ncbi:MAG TPA: dihydroneopterin aldolase [Actinomycetota bacterium]|nr:dihydroneopterin aldolase [Actinomycetota bacterium]
MPQLLRVTGIAADGRHGASEGERDEPQRFAIDLEVVVDASDDDLGSTADYRDLARVARSAVEEGSYAILETIAEQVSAAVAEVPGVLTCRAVVHKPAAADRLGVADVSAEATAGRLGR